MKTLLITGGAGFIGSNFIRYLLQKYDDYRIINYDKLTYAGNLENLRDVEDDSRYQFIKGDICDAQLVNQVTQEVDIIINFAAESHVDRSILDPGSFIQTDVYGTYVLLEAAKAKGVERYLQISTDEVYGSVEEGSFKETDPLKPNSPYSASKAGGDLIVRAYHETFGLPTLITRSSNNFGPYQYPEKLISLFVTNALDDLPLPLYGDGLNVRDWIYVLDNCEAIDVVLHKGEIGEIYNIGTGNEKSNIWITKKILEILDKPESLIQPVADRLGHDRRYSLDCSKIRALGWQSQFDLEQALVETVRWYAENEKWWRRLKKNGR
ncbi:dTDP-glucose 4,6-dehydratase [Candidatus Hakubella thermalkaliphila]|uniref:dTDP-glucose 4,6-dehydratase n=2 Tax=Candidatus Hakubella thermalkaliphila TaxID=2754717 RepID=A0A6V8NIR0_9ACTN|nr:dTDP-glucose 4,6-dehydratase [Candidatus Hakubella thermalkaliphila]MBT9169679.1 dTDP-glucose 4,6-dehydratase 2 [Actinomycetota bacterium]GFP19251.1 dTDP-glucose 4,6-dehydratase [Candidatus Hakubella thermalkaliphila]GFP30871.1 dTDP-glucose 4,6-dehydratase [Candidatus Hakubella thermalkaliphila]GFP37509.1 dTDP-glucose 4,6-dehydratase [Candidatus Hakubella thermalkaliphila]GFP38919.1 dTDP-glucose 4,6-dehydratase [Candidatus Hakubella thermalkaliphila]